MSIEDFPINNQELPVEEKSINQSINQKYEDIIAQEKQEKNDSAEVGEIKKIIAEIPIKEQENIIKILKNGLEEQVQLVKDFIKGIKKGGIDYTNPETKKALVFLGIFLLTSAFSVVQASEIPTPDLDDNPDNDNLDSGHVVNALVGANTELKAMGMTDSGQNVFNDTAFQLATKMESLKAPQEAYYSAIKEMIQAAKWINGEERNMEDLASLLAAVANNHLDACQNLEIIDLPEKVALDFDAHFTAAERVNIQQYYDVTIEEIHAAATQLGEWDEKYGTKDKFSEFEKEVKNYMKQLIDSMDKLEEDVKRPDVVMKTSVIGHSPDLAAEGMLHGIAAKVGLLNVEETAQDAFDDLSKSMDQKY
jgi:hypothetical protein